MFKTGISEDTNAVVGIKSQEDEFDNIGNSLSNKQIDLKHCNKTAKKTAPSTSMSDIQITEHTELDVDKKPEEKNVTKTSTTVDISRDKAKSTTPSSDSYDHLVDKTKVNSSSLF